MASEFDSGQLILMSNLPSGQVVKKVKLHHCAGPRAGIANAQSETPLDLVEG